MGCFSDLSVVKGLVMLLRIAVAEPDKDQVNHLLEGRLNCNHRQISVSFTGPAPLGREGDWVQVRWSGTCQALRTVIEHPHFGPMGGKAWLCTADTMEL